MYLSAEITRMRMRQKTGDALADQKGGAAGPKGSIAKSHVPQHPAQSGGENIKIIGGLRIEGFRNYGF